MSEITIDYRNPDAKEKILEALDSWLSEDTIEKLEIQIEHIYKDSDGDTYVEMYKDPEKMDFVGRRLLSRFEVVEER